LRQAAEAAVGSLAAGIDEALIAAAGTAARSLGPERRWIRGLYSGGTLCAEAQVVLRQAGEPISSNAPIPGVAPLDANSPAGHTLIDLGADAYTVGRPHPMIEPAVRVPHLVAALADPAAAIVLVDVVLGYGGHRDPAASIAAAVHRAPAERPLVIASVCGAAGDPQGYDEQIAALRRAGILVASSNAEAAALAVQIIRRDG
jgi:FdrA protein